MIEAYWNGFRVTEVRDYAENTGRSVQIAVDSAMHSSLIWVDRDAIELKEAA